MVFGFSPIRSHFQDVLYEVCLFQGAIFNFLYSQMKILAANSSGDLFIWTMVSMQFNFEAKPAYRLKPSRRCWRIIAIRC